MQPWPNKKDCTYIYKKKAREAWFELIPLYRNLLVLRDGKQVSDLRLDIRYLPTLKPSKRADGTIVPAAESSKRYIFCFLLISP